MLDHSPTAAVKVTMNDRQDEQRRLIVEQFTKQAVPFSQMPHHNDEDTNRLVVVTAGTRKRRRRLTAQPRSLFASPTLRHVA
jgi:hypothetical protein